MVVNLTNDNKAMDPVNIVYVISGDLWAGAEVQVYHTLCDLIDRCNHSFTVILFNGSKLSNKLTEKGLECIIIDENNNNAFMLLLKLALTFIRKKPGILHVHGYKEHVLVKFACIISHCNAQIVRTFHGISEAPSGLPFIKSIKSNLVHALERYLMRNCNLISVSKDLGIMLKGKYPNANIRQIYNGIPYILPEKGDCQQTRKEYGIGKETLWITTFSRLEKIKNLGMLLDAGNLLKARGMNFHISIFGLGPLRSYLDSRIIEYNLMDSVRLEGFVDDVMPILNSIDLFVLTSFHEGLPMSLLEAMNREVPVICTRVGGIKEVVQDRVTGLLIPSRDVFGFCDAIIELNYDIVLRKRMSTEARKYIEKYFSIRNTNLELLKMYDSLLN